MDFEQWRIAIEHTLVPLAGIINMRRRNADDPRTPGPATQIGLSIIVALIIGMVSGISSGYISAQIALAVHKQRLDDHEKRIDKSESRLDLYFDRLHK